MNANMMARWCGAGVGAAAGEVKENFPEREALRLRWAVLALAGVLATLAAAAALDRRLPEPLMRHNASAHRFIAENAYEHLVNLTSIGPRVAGSYQNEVVAVSVVVAAARSVAAAASPHNRVELDVHTASGAFPLAFIDGMSHMYRDVQSVVVRVRGAGARRPARSALLLNCHYDTVPDSPGASDDAAGCAVVLETLRALAAAPRALRHDVLALLNGAEENVLQASHAFVTSHRWASAARAVVNLEACGAGGREVLFQAGPEPWLAEVYAASAPHPFASSLAQELFRSGLIPADTDYRIFRDFGNISGVDLAWSANGYVYHTRLDTAARVPLGSLQRAGDNVLALAHALLSGEWLELAAERSAAQPVFFDVAGLLALSARAPAALLLALLTLALVAARLLLHARLAQAELYLGAGAWRRAVAAAARAALGGGAAGLAAAAGAGAALHAAHRRLAFYARPELLAPLYAAPALGVSWWVGHALWRRSAAGRALRGRWAARAWEDATVALHGAALAAGTAAGLRSAFLPALWALPLAGAGAAAAAARARPAVSAALLPAAAALPALQTAYLAHASLAMFVPIMGRSGTPPLPPDVMMALVTGALALTLCSWMQGLVMGARRPQRLVAAALALCAVALAAAAVGAPYSAERPQRVMVFHTRRTVHAPPAAPRVELLYWIPELDTNTPHSLDHVVAGMAGARAGDAAQCAQLLYCGAPYYLPVLSLVARGHWLPADAPPAPDATLVAHVSTTPHNSTVQMLHLNITGPSHVVLIVSPAAGARLGALAALGAPQPGPAWRDEAGALRRTYFFALHDARRPRAWLLDLPIEHSFPEPPAQWAALSLAGHALAAPRGRALGALLGALPAWTAPTGWDVDMHLYTV